MERDSRGFYVKGHTCSQEIRDKISKTKTIYPTKKINCEICGREFEFKVDKHHPDRHFCSMKCQVVRGRKIGSITKMNNGYLRIWNPHHPLAKKDGQVLYHRYVWFEHYGSLQAGIHVHHINGDRTDNRIENLEIYTNSEHQKLHRQPGTLIKNQYGTFVVKKRL